MIKPNQQEKPYVGLRESSRAVAQVARQGSHTVTGQSRPQQNIQNINHVPVIISQLYTYACTYLYMHTGYAYNYRLRRSPA